MLESTVGLGKELKNSRLAITCSRISTTGEKNEHPMPALVMFGVTVFCLNTVLLLWYCAQARSTVTKISDSQGQDAGCRGGCRARSRAAEKRGPGPTSFDNL